MFLDERLQTRDERNFDLSSRRAFGLLGFHVFYFSFFFLSLFIFSACTDYSQQFEDDYEYGRTGKGVVFEGDSLKDLRDNHVYGVAQVGGLYWMMDDLAHEYYTDEKYKSTYCYKDRTKECDKAGRLYPGEHLDNACPKGWRLPTKEEWLSFYSTTVFRDHSTEKTDYFKGYVSGDYSLNDRGYKAYYWASGDALADGYNPCVSFDNNWGSLSTGELCHEQWKLSVRCVTDADK